MINRLRQLCQSDERIVAALLYGSFTTGEADIYSDIECVLFFDPQALPTINKQQWVDQIAPTLLFFADDFGHYTAIFDNLVRGEFHFDSADDMGKVATWKGSAWFPTVESTLLVDRKGTLSDALQPLIGASLDRDNQPTVDRLVNNFVNLVIFGMNTWRRGEYARSHELLQNGHRLLIWMVRILEHQTSHWPTPSKCLEKDLSTESYARLVDCTSSLDPTSLQQAYQNSWEWGQELIAQLRERHPVTLPDRLLSLIDTQFFEMPST
jgi:lincosamide nucleotidyltransferase